MQNIPLFLAALEFFQKVWEWLWEHLLIAITVAVILIAFGILWRQIRAVINRLFSKIPIQGKWETTLIRGTTHEEHEDAELYQLINRVWGMTKTKSEPKRAYEVKGRICGQKLCLTYEQVKGPGIDNGGIILNIRANGTEMNGYEVGTDIQTETDNISAFEYRWKKKPNQ